MWVHYLALKKALGRYEVRKHMQKSRMKLERKNRALHVTHVGPSDAKRVSCVQFFWAFTLCLRCSRFRLSFYEDKLHVSLALLATT